MTFPRLIFAAVPLLISVGLLWVVNSYALLRLYGVASKMSQSLTIDEAIANYSSRDMSRESAIQSFLGIETIRVSTTASIVTCIACSLATGGLFWLIGLRSASLKGRSLLKTGVTGGDAADLDG